MLHLLFFDRVDNVDRQICLLSWGFFAIAESLLFFLSAPFLLLFLFGTGTFLVGFSIGRFRFSPKLWFQKIGIDQVFLLSLVTTSWLGSVWSIESLSSSPIMPGGILFPRLTLPQEIFSILMLFLALAVIAPAWDDPRHVNLYSKYQPLKHYPSLPFTRRRTFSALGIIFMFWFIGLLTLPLYKHWILHSAVIGYWVLWTIAYWEWVYGYHSIIVYLFGGYSLALSIAGIAIGANERWIRFVFEVQLFYLVLVVPVLIIGYGGIYALRVLWNSGEKIYILPEEKLSHMVMIVMMIIGLFAIYFGYIAVPIFQYWWGSKLSGSSA